MKSKYVFKLYVISSSPRSQTAIENLKTILAQHLADGYDLQVTDVLANPELLESEKILATPTVVREYPTPQKRIIGDMSDTFLVATGLELPTQPKSASKKKAKSKGTGPKKGKK